MAYVDNLVQGVALAERHPAAPGQAFWVADRDAYPLGEVVDHGAPGARRGGVPHPRRASSGSRGRSRRRPRRPTARCSGRGRYSAQVHVLGELAKTIRCDISRTVEVLGYDPRVSLLEGMRRSVAGAVSQGFDIGPASAASAGGPA